MEVLKQTAAQRQQVQDLLGQCALADLWQSWGIFYPIPILASILTDWASRLLHACEALLDSYAQRVFDAHDENR